MGERSSSPVSSRRLYARLRQLQHYSAFAIVLYMITVRGDEQLNPGPIALLSNRSLATLTSFCSDTAYIADNIQALLALALKFSPNFDLFFTK